MRGRRQSPARGGATGSRISAASCSRWSWRKHGLQIPIRHVCVRVRWIRSKWTGRCHPIQVSTKRAKQVPSLPRKLAMMCTASLSRSSWHWLRRLAFSVSSTANCALSRNGGRRSHVAGLACFQDLGGQSRVERPAVDEEPGQELQGRETGARCGFPAPRSRAGSAPGARACDGGPSHQALLPMNARLPQREGRCSRQGGRRRFGAEGPFGHPASAHTRPTLSSTAGSPRPTRTSPPRSTRTICAWPRRRSRATDS